jgi:hypothetical protein
MALSKNVKDSLDEAKSHLRNALAFSARAEHPLVLEGISRLLLDVEKLQSLTNFQEQLEKLKSGDDDGGPINFQSFFQQ